MYFGDVIVGRRGYGERRGEGVLGGRGRRWWLLGGWGRGSLLWGWYCGEGGGGGLGLRGSGMCGRWCGGRGVGRRGFWGLYYVISLVAMRKGLGGRKRTFGIKLHDVDVAVCVCYNNVELFAVREKIGGYDF